MYISLFFFLINTFFASNRRSIYLCFFLISSLGVYYKLFETRKLPLFFFKVIQSKRYFFFLFPFFSLSFLSLFHIFFNKFFQLDSLLLFVNNKVISRSFFFFCALKCQQCHFVESIKKRVERWIPMHSPLILVGEKQF